MSTPIPSSSPRDANFVPLPRVAVSVVSGMQSNTTTATAVQLITVATPCRQVDVSAYSTNTNTIAIGSSTVKAEGTAGSKTGTGVQLLKGTTQSFLVAEASSLYLAVSTANDGISYNIYV